MSEEQKDLFAVFAEVEGYDNPLILRGLTFARLIDDIVIPYEKKEPFFIDGAPIAKKEIRKLKILRQTKAFPQLFGGLHYKLRHGPIARQKIYGEQYNIRMEAILRSGCEDVTSQVIKAFNAKIGPKMKDYLPKREELINAAYRVFLAAMKILGNTHSS